MLGPWISDGTRLKTYVEGMLKECVCDRCWRTLEELRSSRVHSMRLHWRRSRGEPVEETGRQGGGG